MSGERTTKWALPPWLKRPSALPEAPEPRALVKHEPAAPIMPTGVELVAEMDVHELMAVLLLVLLVAWIAGAVP